MMELRSIIKQPPLLERGNNKYIVLIMGVVGLLVGGLFATKFIMNIFR